MNTITINNIKRAWRDGYSHGQILDMFPELTREQEFAITIRDTSAEKLLSVWNDIKVGMGSKDILALLNGEK